MRLKNGWYILNYHDINWEENLYISGIGGTFPPDIFREHLREFSKVANLVSIQDGFREYQKGSINEPLISLWFDDGFVGVRRYAMGIMSEFNLTGAISVNSRFTLRKELFWRLKLSFLSHIDGLRFLRSRLKAFGYQNQQNIKSFVMDNFSLEIVNIIDEVYQQFTRDIDREDAFRIFDTVEGLNILKDNGWEIANHSASHYPISEKSYIEHFVDEFMECEEFLNRDIDIQSRFWVLPFDRDSVETDTLLEYLDSSRYLVKVGDRVNQKNGNRVLYRIEPPYLNGIEIVRYLKNLY